MPITHPRSIGVWGYLVADTDAVPASGKVGVNDADPTLATAIFLHDTDADGVVRGASLDAFGGEGRYLTIKPVGSESVELVYRTTGPFAASGAGGSFPVAFVSRLGTEPSNDEECYLSEGFGTPPVEGTYLPKVGPAAASGSWRQAPLGAPNDRSVAGTNGTVYPNLTPFRTNVDTVLYRLWHFATGPTWTDLGVDLELNRGMSTSSAANTWTAVRHKAENRELRRLRDSATRLNPAGSTRAYKYGTANVVFWHPTLGTAVSL